MATEKFEKSKETTDNEDAAVKPDPETLNTTDPQEHMKGPLSSLMHKAEDTFDSDKPEAETKENTDE